MSNANPTALRLGATGMLDGRNYTVAGRTVLGVEVDGTIYYWNEFNLTTAAGQELILVHEETEDGSLWKLFKQLEPLRALSPAEARERKTGDSALIDGKTVRVTLTGRSRVYFTEGRVPEGVEQGDVADYFNAEAGGKMFAVSWTGEEIEYFEGETVSARRIEDAFKLPRRPAGLFSLAQSGAPAGGGSGLLLTVVVMGVLCAIGFWTYQAGRGEKAPAPRAKQAAPATRLPDGARAVVGPHAYTVTGHALVEVAAVGGRYDRHEYDLSDESGGHALLINGLGGEAGEWHLLTPLEPPRDFGPYEAAAVRRGGTRDVAGRMMQVMQLFLARVLAVDGRPAAGVWPATLQYGIVARLKDEWVVARWTETRLQFFGGRVLAEADVKMLLKTR